MSNYLSQNTDFNKITKVALRKIGLLLICFAFLYLDSTFFAKTNKNGQLIVNCLAVFGYVLLYYKSVSRIRKMLIYTAIIGFFGEYFFSIYLNMYTYRLGGVPFYVPLGHAILYLRIFAFTKSAVVKKYSNLIQRYFVVLISVFALASLYFYNDVFGFLMTIGVFLIAYFNPKVRLKFLTIYIIVAIMEFEGTAMQIWKWPNTAFGIFDFLPSHNPPSGISFFYFIAPIGCFLFYKNLNKKVWKRLKNIRKIKAKNDLVNYQTKNELL